MATSFIRYHTPVINKTSGTTIPIVIGTGGIPAGRTVVIGIVCDNIAQFTPVISSITMPAGQTGAWTIYGPGGATSTSGGATRVLMAHLTSTVLWAAGSTLTVTLSAAVTAKVAFMGEWDDVGAWGGASHGGVNNTAGAPSTTVSAGSCSAGGLMVAVAGFETPTIPVRDSVETNGSWDTGITAATSGGSSATNVSGIMQWRIPVTSGIASTYTPTNADAVDSTSGVFAWPAPVAGGFASSVYLGSTKVTESKVYLGTTAVTRIYKGTALVYGSEPTIPPRSPA